MEKINALLIIDRIAKKFEDNGNFVIAEKLNDIYFKLAKKKSKKSKNVPNNPELWAQCKAEAKRKFDVYPSAYANGWAAKKYKSKGGTWRKEK